MKSPVPTHAVTVVFGGPPSPRAAHSKSLKVWAHPQCSPVTQTPGTQKGIKLHACYIYIYVCVCVCIENTIVKLLLICKLQRQLNAKECVLLIYFICTGIFIPCFQL